MYFCVPHPYMYCLSVVTREVNLDLVNLVERNKKKQMSNEAEDTSIFDDTEFTWIFDKKVKNERMKRKRTEMVAETRLYASDTNFVMPTLDNEDECFDHKTHGNERPTALLKFAGSVIHKYKPNMFTANVANYLEWALTVQDLCLHHGVATPQGRIRLPKLVHTIISFIEKIDELARESVLSFMQYSNEFEPWKPEIPRGINRESMMHVDEHREAYEKEVAEYNIKFAKWDRAAKTAETCDYQLDIFRDTSRMLRSIITAHVKAPGVKGVRYHKAHKAASEVFHQAEKCSLYVTETETKMMKQLEELKSTIDLIPSKPRTNQDDIDFITECIQAAKTSNDQDEFDRLNNMLEKAITHDVRKANYMMVKVQEELDIYQRRRDIMIRDGNRGKLLRAYIKEFGFVEGKKRQQHDLEVAYCVRSTSVWAAAVKAKATLDDEFEFGDDSMPMYEQMTRYMRKSEAMTEADVESKAKKIKLTK